MLNTILVLSLNQNLFMTAILYCALKKMWNFFPVEKSFEMIIRYHHVMEMDSLLFNTIQQRIYVADGNNTFWNRYTYSQNRFRKVKIENNI